MDANPRRPTNELLWRGAEHTRSWSRRRKQDIIRAALDLNPLNSEAVDDLVARALADIEATVNLEALKIVKSALLGDQTPLVLANRGIGQLVLTDRGTAGKNLGGARVRLSQALTERGQIPEAEHEARILAGESVDITASGARLVIGACHPIGTLIEEIKDFFTSMDWEIMEGSEIEREQFNSDSLSFDIDHPVRQIQDTLYIDGTTVGGEAPGDGCLVMRAHTLPVQPYSLLARGTSLYVTCPGRAPRLDTLDATRAPVFHQIEGLAVDKGLAMAHLKSVLDHFAKVMFGPDARARLRPPFFPLTEPSVELDMWFPQKKGGAGWIEVGGCGMVNPGVLHANGIDPDEHMGFAFGMGIEYTLMLRRGIANMHDIVEGGVRSSQQFGLHRKGH